MRIGAVAHHLVGPPSCRSTGTFDASHRSRTERRDGDDQRGGPIEHRAIGVVYRPELEPVSNYVPSLLPLRYDALVYFEQAHALSPFGFAPRPGPEAMATYPFGV